ncbi:MAG: nucleotidyl transferase AbiEii/AbiGii toxin family protein [Spirochaetales bacterium]|nr:nucleotidyl transferase AbiEii/AbiGii toxin family protein [Spirochaetales bacterium]
MDINRHKFLLIRILKEIYSDIELANSLGFKGGTALMLFYDLPRFSVDLDFNLLEKTKSKTVIRKIEKLLLQFGKIKDQAVKHFESIAVLNYGENERNLKVEISERAFPDSYEIRNYLGINIRVMLKPDMFAHKLCALTDRKTIAARDVFDSWYFMENRTAVNENIIETRMQTSYDDYLGKCIESVEGITGKSLASGLGELIKPELKDFVKTRLKDECITLLKMYREIPLLA